MWLYHIKSSKKNKNTFNLYSKEKLDLLEKNEYIVKLKYDKNKNGFVFHSIISENPVFSIPYLPQLEERIKIMNFHVPMAWLTVLAYLISMIYSVNYLRKQDMFDDIKASSAAYLGTVFCILATHTVAVWAKYKWVSYWNWDPRQTSIFVLLLIYFAYFILRSSIENEKMRARLSSVYSIIAFVTVPFFIFILPRIASGLHPGSSSEDTIGPVLATKSDMLNPTMHLGFGISIIAFSMLFFWLLNLHIRAKKMNE
jgi:heme exporter protein C